jgi:thiamine biosynthesis protein ThiI
MQGERLILIHYHEIGLKGKNRGWFEQQQQRNIDRALKGVPRGQVRRLPGRIIQELTPDSPLDVVRERLSGVFGIANFSEAIIVPRDIQAICETAWAMAQQKKFASFKVVTKRGDKTFPHTSTDINREVGTYIQNRTHARVMMDNPDLTIFVEIASSRSFVYIDKVQGLGGLPAGSNEHALSLISSGIDSPVASFKIMKRGVKLSYLHFHSQPYTNRNSQRNTEEIVKLLTRYQFESDLYLVPFVEIQRHIMAHAPASYRVVLYRRYMLRFAQSIAERIGALALVTGDNVGQVASQTLSNLRAIEEVTLLPVLRPLAGDNKDDIIALARKIGTYDISVEPYEDCCSVFVPKHPETKAKLETIHRIESQFDMAPLMAQTLEQIDIKTFKP